ERHDHSTAIADAAGRLVAQAEWSLPIHLASMLGLLDILIQKYSDDIHEGDIFIANDPHVAGGTHLPDLALVSPVFVDGKLSAFVANLAHHADVGGAAQGSMSGGMREIWQEGLRIPVMRLYSRGQLNSEVMELLLLNMRLPEERRGDLNAQIAACHLGVQRMKTLFGQYGNSTVSTAFAEILARTDRRMKTAIAQIPDGSYNFEDVLDDDGLDARDIRFKLEVRKTGEQIVFDFTGTDPQVPGNVNLTLNAVQSAVCYALKSLLDPALPNNQAAIDAIDIIAPVGTIANCVTPGAVALRANTCQRVVDVIIGALADVLPDQAIGAANGANTSIVFAGTDPGTGSPYVYLETLGGGMGARSDKDGKDGVQVHITNTSNLPIEAIEMEYPLRVESYGLVEDSGGAGRHRGGLGLRRVVRPIGHVCELNGVGERFRHQPWGIFGGKPGASGRFRLREPDGSIDELPPKTGRRWLSPDQAVIVETPGAGGYGQPATRTAEDLETDQASEKFSAEFMQRHYKD
ncbi:MAG: hydantoinase B/oxoprolinase family protein, partial [Pseudomonadota bacterium]